MRPRQTAHDGTRRLRVGVLVTGLAITGGLERCVLEDTRELVAAGHEVEVWHRNAQSPRAAEGPPPYEAMGVTLVEATDYRFGITTALRDAWRFAREGLRIRRSHLDVLWLNRPEYLPFGRVASLVSGVPLAVHLHHAPNYRRLGPIAGGRTRYFAVSHAMARAWAESGVPTDRITIVPNGVDTDAFPAATPASVHDARAALGHPRGHPDGAVLRSAHPVEGRARPPGGTGVASARRPRHACRSPLPRGRSRGARAAPRARRCALPGRGRRRARRDRRAPRRFRARAARAGRRRPAPARRRPRRGAVHRARGLRPGRRRGDVRRPSGRRRRIGRHRGDPVGRLGAVHRRPGRPRRTGGEAARHPRRSRARPVPRRTVPRVGP